MSHYGDPHDDSFADYRGHVAKAVWRTFWLEPFFNQRTATLILSVGCLAAGARWSIASMIGETDDWLPPVGMLAAGVAATWWWTRIFRSRVLEVLRRERAAGRYGDSQGRHRSGT